MLYLINLNNKSGLMRSSKLCFYLILIVNNNLKIIPVVHLKNLQLIKSLILMHFENCF